MKSEIIQIIQLLLLINVITVVVCVKILDTSDSTTLIFSLLLSNLVLSVVKEVR